MKRLAVIAILFLGGCHAYQHYFIEKWYGPDDCQKIDAKEKALPPEHEDVWIRPVTSDDDFGPAA